MDTPISALPSRFVSDALLPSPSSFFPEWGFGRSGPDTNMLPSPLTFPTPSVQTGPSFQREDELDRKRKSPEGGALSELAGTSKKLKT
jgi:MADS-box transcription factor